MLNSSLRGPRWVSFCIVAVLIMGALWFHLVGACVVGFLIYSLTHRLSDRLEQRFHGNHHVRTVVILALVTVIALSVGALALTLLHFFRDDQRLNNLMLSMADVLVRARAGLPEVMANHVPFSIEMLKSNVVDGLRTHQQGLSDMGMDSLHSAGHLLIGVIGGTMVSFARFESPARYFPLSAELLQRFTRLRAAFDKVVLAQFKIAAINTALTAFYLLVVLPCCGVHVPLATTMVALTFGLGLLPVIGNLVSNLGIVVLSLGVSLHVAMASLIFLVVVHKLEYFLNARIIGRNIQAAAWEMILVMLGMDVVFGVGGLIAAPVLYAYLKWELLTVGWIGRRTPLSEPSYPIEHAPGSPVHDAVGPSNGQPDGASRENEG